MFVRINRLINIIFQIGRLLLRKAASECLGMPYNDICFARTDKGKPYITNSHSHMPGFNVNISHQGDYAVLVADACHDVGVDIMKVEYPSKSWPNISE